MILIKKNELKILEESNCIRYLYNRLEELATDHLHKLQRKVIKNSETGFVPYATHKNMPKSLIGFYMVSKPEKITIYWKKQKTGYICNYFEIIKIVSFMLVKPKKNANTQIYLRNEKSHEWEEKCSFKAAYWEEIHTFFNNFSGSEVTKQLEFVFDGAQLPQE